jgi:peptide/nickel transport system substrate-binding protein
MFENPANQTGPTAKYYYRYVFGLNTSIPIYFQTFPNGTQGYRLTAEDVVYSFQRTMVQDRLDGPSWMLYEPLLDNNIGADVLDGGIANLTNTTQVSELGQLINNSVQVNPANSSEIWFNLMFPGAYGSFMQILSQTCSSIISKSWIRNEVISQAGRPDWNGEWSTYTDWVNCHNPVVSPLDSPTPMEYGSGPFQLTTGTPNYTSKFWALDRYAGYFRGWPAGFPFLLNARPAGFVDTVNVTWAFDWTTRKAMFLNGDCDFCALPSTAYIKELYQSPVPPFDPPFNYPLQGLRCIHPLPTLQCDAIFFTFSINSTTTWETMGNENEFNLSNVPPDLFSNANWGIHMRRAFAKAFDYANYLATVLNNSGVTPATALIEGLAYHDASVVGYLYNLPAAKAELDQCVDKNGKKVTDVGAGMTLNLYYDTGNFPRKTGCEFLKAGLESATCDPNGVFTINVIGIDWGTYLTAAATHGLACYAIGRVADFPDPHDFAFPFYHTGGALAGWQNYSNSTMDALIDQGIVTPNGPARQAIYHNIQVLAVADVPDFPIDQPIIRHFEKDWVNGWYCSAIYPGLYFYNMWKWYYITLARYTPPPYPLQPNSTYLPADVNYDGVIDPRDVATVMRAFNTHPGMTRWNFRADITGNRKIEIDDIAFVSKQWNPARKTPVWTPGSFSMSSSPFLAHLNASLLPSQAYSYTLPAMWIEPADLNISFTVGTKFNVTIWVGLNSDSSVWESALRFDTAYLTATRAGFTNGSTSEFYSGHTTSPAYLIDDSGGGVYYSEILYDVRGAGTGSLCWVEFQVIAPANETTLSLNDQGSFVLDTNLNDIPLSFYDARIKNGFPDVAVTDFASSKTVVFQGCSMNVTVTVANLGGLAEDFSVTVYANATAINTQSFSLISGSNETRAFMCNTGLAYGNYTLKATADLVSGDTNTTNNNFTGAWVFVAGVGDLTGGTSNPYDFVPDGKVLIDDVAVVSKCFAQKVPPAPANCDVSGPTTGVPDGKILIDDVAMVSRHFGQRYSYP